MKVLKIVGVLVLLIVVVNGVWIMTGTNVRQLRDAASLTPDGKAQKTHDQGALDYSVATRISAPPAIVWSVLTDAPSYTTWNSTFLKMEGTIAQGSKINIVVKDAPEQNFPLEVSTLEAPKRMVWEDGGKIFMGVRNFTLTPNPDGSTAFAMSETFSGRMLSMIEPKLPDFTHSFEVFAADLKKASEAKAPPPPPPPAAAPEPDAGAAPAP
jgi:uncharacterized protein YndB with AHSA1/START domain